MVGWRLQVWRVGTAAMLLASAPAHAAEQPMALAQKALTAGKPDLAIRSLTAGLAGSAFKGGDIAKAYLLRGQANAKAGHEAAAISDFNTALYLKGLSETERQTAMAAKAGAYQTAGVAAAGSAAKAPAAAPAAVPAPNLDAVVTTAPPAKRSRKAAPPAAAAAGQTASADPLPWQGAAAQSPAPAPAKPSAGPTDAPDEAGNDNPVSAMLGGLFSFGQSSPAPAPAAAEPAPAVTATATAASASTAAPVWKTAGLAPESAKAARTAKAGGGLYLQVASLRTTSEAQAMADKLAADHAAALDGLSPSITPTVLGNMGTFYAVRLGPVASKAAGTAVCARLRKEGVDCFFSTP